jgi:hypothetical protein
MVERYTERARRAIFFARYEASVFGSVEITAEELLLGILREDKTAAMQAGLQGAGEAIRKELERLTPPAEQRVSMSVEFPLSAKAREALRFGAEEADALGHKNIDSAHLLLGLMRLEDGVASQLLKKHAIGLEAYRKIVAQGSVEAPASLRLLRPHERPGQTPVEPQAAALKPVISAVRQLIDVTTARLRASTDSYGEQRLKRKPWTRKEALGHLIDWAIAHQQWLAWALLQPMVRTAGYPAEEAVAAQRYATFAWAETVDLWISLNLLLVHVLLQVPESKLGVPCRIGVAEPVPLSKLMEAYFAYCEDIVGQIFAHLD